MNRVDQLFKDKEKEVLTIYFTAGYPQLNDTLSIVRSISESGADLIEVGMPYSDPLADGPVIQASSQQALKNGMNLDLLFKQLAEVRAHTQIPIVLMGYYNQVLQFGIEEFCKISSSVGVDGFILPDLPLEEFYSFCKPIFDRYSLTCTFLVTPSSSDDRIRELDEATSGFLYAVSSHSITGGSAASQLDEYGNKLASLNLKNPIQVGFGIHDSESFLNACSIGSGGIIGSAFIKAISQPGELEQNIKSFIHGVKSRPSNI